ncbi:hypothetical protein EDB80DRAFT_868128 [Ilyonectria destructans]|nr:hypothetical protein EDB80DRAFT_868128 [Ilyonectria destructans]
MIEDHIKAFPFLTGNLEGVRLLLKTKTLEYTLVYTGLFLDYYCVPRIPSYMNVGIFVMDIAHNSAAIAGTGNVPVNFCHTKDIAQLLQRV